MSPLHLELFTVDSFTQTPFRGNPAAVCFLTDPSIVQLIDERFPTSEQKEDFYKLVAREMNLSETCFLRRVANQAENYFELRWFTPTVEVNLCGHATLAAAHLLFEQGNVVGVDHFKFTTRSGELTVEKVDGKLKMNFPEGDPQVLNSEMSPELVGELLKNLNLPNDASIVSELVLCRKTKKLLVVLKDLKHVLQAEPNEQALLQMNFKSDDLNAHIKGISVNMPVSTMDDESKKVLSGLVTDVNVDEVDFITRYFSPW